MNVQLDLPPEVLDLIAERAAAIVLDRLAPAEPWPERMEI